MDKQTAVSLIQTMVDSLKTNPSQFIFDVTVVGTNAINYGGGTALSVTATGGGPGSNTIGYQSSVDASNISFAQKSVNDEIQNQMKKLTDVLDGIIVELKQEQLDNSQISDLYKSLLGK